MFLQVLFDAAAGFAPGLVRYCNSVFAFMKGEVIVMRTDEPIPPSPVLRGASPVTQLLQQRALSTSPSSVPVAAVGRADSPATTPLGKLSMRARASSGSEHPSPPPPPLLPTTTHVAATGGETGGDTGGETGDARGPDSGARQSRAAVGRGLFDVVAFLCCRCCCYRCVLLELSLLCWWLWWCGGGWIIIRVCCFLPPLASLVRSCLPPSLRLLAG